MAEALTGKALPLVARTIEPFVIDAESSTLLLGDTALPVGRRAVSILTALVEHGGVPITKDRLIQLAWGGRAIEESNLSVQIAILRKALGRVPGGERWIETLPRRGYRFVGPHQMAGPAPPEQDKNGYDSDETSWRVGRSIELNALEALSRRSAQGKRSTAFVTGDAGIGKSTLLDMITGRLTSRGATVLTGCCTERFGTDGGFGPLVDALASHCRQPRGKSMLAALRAAAPTWLLQMPHLIEDGQTGSFAQEIFGATKERMLREFCELLESLSQSQTWVLVLEDLHWADLATLDVLSRLARGTGRACLLIIASYRPDAVEYDHPLRRLHGDLELHGSCRGVRLGTLSREDVQKTLDARFQDPALSERLAAAIYARSGGQPLFVTSLIEYFIAEQIVSEVDGRWRLHSCEALSRDVLPETLVNMITQEIGRLPKDDQQLLEVAAIAGCEFSAALVAAGLERDVLDTEHAFESLLTRSPILRSLDLSEWPDGTVSTNLAFMHSMYQSVLYKRISAGRRAVIHRRLADRLRHAWGDNTAGVAATLALHAEQGRDPQNALRFLAQAAEVSMRQWRFDDAINYLSRALAIVDRFDRSQQLEPRLALLRHRSWARRSVGDLAGSVSDLNALIKEAAAAGLLRSEVNGLLAVSHFCVHSDRRLCLQASDAAFEKSKHLDDPQHRALVQGTSASTNLYFKGWSSQDAELCERAIQVASGAKDHITLIRVYAIEGILECWRSNYATCVAVGAKGKRLAREAGDVYVYVIFNILETTALLHLGEWRPLLRETEEALAMAERNANLHASALCHLTMAWLSTEALDFEGALKLCDKVPEESGRENPFVFFFQHAVRAKAHVGLRQAELARPQFAAIADRVAHEGIDLDFTIYTQLYHCLGEYELMVGDLRQARNRATQLEKYARPAPDRTHLSIAYALHARVSLAEGDLPSAVDYIEQATNITREFRLPLASWRVHKAAVDVYSAIGDTNRLARHRELGCSVLHNLASEFEVGDIRHQSLMSAAARLGG
ncbi:MAG: AAA family ATPase [Hyphomicrobiaceae bacterium]|nr:AAA family ATPase [Hyphomicrobiaceae bacterium]